MRKLFYFNVVHYCFPYRRNKMDVNEILMKIFWVIQKFIFNLIFFINKFVNEPYLM